MNTTDFTKLRDSLIAELIKNPEFKKSIKSVKAYSKGLVLGFQIQNTGAPITLEELESLTLQQIIDACCIAYHTSEHEFHFSTKRDVVIVRKAFFFIAKNYGDWSYSSIQKAMKTPIDRSTIIHHIRTYEDLIAVSKPELSRYESILRILKIIK